MISLMLNVHTIFEYITALVVQLLGYKWNRKPSTES